MTIGEFLFLYRHIRTGLTNKIVSRSNVAQQVGVNFLDMQRWEEKNMLPERVYDKERLKAYFQLNSLDNITDTSLEIAVLNRPTHISTDDAVLRNFRQLLDEGKEGLEGLRRNAAPKIAETPAPIVNNPPASTQAYAAQPSRKDSLLEELKKEVYREYKEMVNNRPLYEILGDLDARLSMMEQVRR